MNIEAPSVLETVPCVVCGSDKYKTLYTVHESRSWWKEKCRDDARLSENLGFPICQCSECSFTYVNPRLREDINREIYEHYWKSPPPVDRHHNHRRSFR